MIRLTNLADYGVVLMCHMAGAPKNLYSAVYLSKDTGIPVPTVSKIMGALSKAGLLTSHRGLKGGFRLERAPEDISVANVIEAVDGPIALTNCIEHAPGDCCYESVCSMKPHWQVINTVIRKGLDSITLDEIASPAPAIASLDPVVFSHSPKTGY